MPMHQIVWQEHSATAAVAMAFTASSLQVKKQVFLVLFLYFNQQPTMKEDGLNLVAAAHQHPLVINLEI